VNGVDLKISPVERSIRIVVVDLAGAAGILGALNGQGDPARGAELIAGILLVGGEVTAELIGLGVGGVPAGEFGGNHNRPLEADFQRGLEAEGIVVAQVDRREDRGHCQQDQQAE